MAGTNKSSQSSQSSQINYQNNKNGFPMTNNVLNSMSNSSALDMYLTQNYSALANSDLRQVVDTDGNTVIHHMASNLDKNALQKISETNPNAITYDVINKSNNNGELPIHKAMQTIQEYTTKNPSGKNSDFLQKNWNNKQQSMSNMGNGSALQYLKNGKNQIDSIFDQKRKKIYDFYHQIIEDTGNFYKTEMDRVNDFFEKQRNASADTLQKMKQKSDQFISYLINLGSNKDIPDKNNRIIVGQESNQSVFYDKTKAKSLNDNVVNNIKNLTQLAQSKANTFGNNLGQILPSTSNPPSIDSMQTNSKIQFINNLTKLYGKAVQTGGRQQGMSNIEDMNSFSEWSNTDTNNSFVTKSKNKLMENYNSAYMHNQDMNKNINKNTALSMNSDLNNLRRQSMDLKLNEEKLRNYRLLGGNDNQKLRQKEKTLRENRQKINQKINKKFNYQAGGKKDFDMDSDSVVDAVDESEASDADDYADVHVDSDPEDTILESEEETRLNDMFLNNRTKNNSDSLNLGINSDDSDDSVDSVDSDSNNTDNVKNKKSKINNSNFLNYSNIFSSQERPRDEKASEIYRSFVQKIMDLLGVDEQTAREYRSFVKITIENTNPELRKRENDALKIKEMENIFENKDKLQKMLDKINMEDLRKYMAERKEFGENRRKENENRRKDKSKDKSKDKNSDKNSDKNKDKNKMTLVKNTDSAMDKISKSKNTDKAKIKTDTNTKPKTTKKSKVVEDGYLKTDEIIFSPDF